jgi:hypothetical protein
MADILWDQDHPGIYIRTSFFGKHTKFFHTTNDALNKIRSEPVGKGLLRTIASIAAMRDEAVKVTIVSKEEGGSSESPMNSQKSLAISQPGNTFMRYRAGEGTSCTVNWAHTKPSCDGKQRPPFIALAHELIHALHDIHGATYRDYSGKLNENSGKAEEEARTVGLGPHVDEPITENKIRAEHNIPLRPSYSGNYFDNVTNSWNDA